MKILVINAGSSSLKYQLIDMDDESVLAKGNCERIGMEDGIFTHKTNDGREKHVTVSMPDHTAASIPRWECLSLWTRFPR